MILENVPDVGKRRQVPTVKICPRWNTQAFLGTLCLHCPEYKDNEDKTVGRHFCWTVLTDCSLSVFSYLTEQIKNISILRLLNLPDWNC